MERQKFTLKSITAVHRTLSCKREVITAVSCAGGLKQHGQDFPGSQVGLS